MAAPQLALVSGRSARRVLDDTRALVLAHEDKILKLECHIREYVDPHRLAVTDILVRSLFGRLKYLLTGK